MSKVVLSCLLLIIPLLLLPNQVGAQQKSTEVSSVYDIADPKANDGDLMIYDSSKGLIRAGAPYDTRLFGVLQKDPLMVYRRADNSGQPVSRSGLATVNASTLNGDIKPGDLVTSSEIVGIGQLANQSGYVVGLALSTLDSKTGTSTDYKPSYDPQTSKKIYLGKVTVAIRVEYAELSSARSTNRLFSFISAAMMRDMKNPQQFTEIFRYIASALVVVVAFAVGFISFSRSIPKSIEAIGRNPLAANSIRLSIVVSIIFTILIGLVGIAAAVVIVKL